MKVGGASRLPAESVVDVVPAAVRRADFVGQVHWKPKPGYFGARIATRSPRPPSGVRAGQVGHLHGAHFLNRLGDVCR